MLEAYEPDANLQAAASRTEGKFNANGLQNDETAEIADLHVRVDSLCGSVMMY